MHIVSALVRVQAEEYAIAWQSLEKLPGVTAFALDDTSRLGLVIECEQLDDAYRLLSNDIPETPGVLCVYPAYAHFDAMKVGT